MASLLIYFLRPVLVRYLLAHPNARSSHSVATPQGAGVGVILVLLIICLAAWLLWRAPPGAMALVPVLAAACGLTVLGLADDVRALPVSWRFIGQTLAALVMVASLPQDLRLLPGLLPFLVERALLVLGTVWFVNAVNFLDGLDWITAAQVVPMTLGLAVLASLSAVPASIGFLALVLLGAMLGFAYFNRHPAQVFLGDAGSLPIGLLLVFMLIYVAGTNLAAALLLALYTISDFDHHAHSPGGEPRAHFQRPPLAFLSTRGDRRHDRAASDGAGVSLGPVHRCAGGGGGARPIRDSQCFAARPWRHRHLLCSPYARARRQVSGRRVLVTGASGFLGKPLVRALAEGGWTVRAASRDPAAIHDRPGVERVALPNLARPVDWSPLLDGVTHILHLAGIAHAPGQLPDEVYSRINTDAVRGLAEAARGRVERVVLMSSVRAQAGLSADHVITEADPAKPTDAYGRSKLAAERLLQGSGVPFTVLRPAVIYGRGVKGNIANLATLAQTPMPLPFGGLDNRRSLLALENLADAVALVLASPQAEGATFLVADSEPISVAELVGAMREGLGRAPHLMRVPLGAVKRLMASFGKEADWDRLSGSFVIDAAKLRAIGWSPRIKTHEGIAAMMRTTNGAGS